MIPSAIEHSETALRRAVERRQLAQVEELTLSYCGVTEAYLATLATGDPARVELLTRVLGVLKWARLMVCLARSGYSEKLTRFLLAKRYLTPPSSGSSVVHLDC